MGDNGKNNDCFITHPDVAIDPAVSIPDWPLNERRERECTRCQPVLGKIVAAAGHVVNVSLFPILVFVVFHVRPSADSDEVAG